MALSQLCVVILIIIIAHLAHAQNFNCDSSCGCCGQEMTCPSSQMCTADCDEGPNACTDAIFNGNGATSFTGDGGTVFDCGGDCSRTTFNMETVTGIVEISGCGGGNCYGIILYCGSKTSDCRLNCGSNGCNSATIICGGTCLGSSCPAQNAGCPTTTSPTTSQPSSSPSRYPTTFQPSLSPSAAPHAPSDYNVSIEIYSLGYNQTMLFNQVLSFIRVNDKNYQVMTSGGWWKGLMIVVLDEHNPAILLDSVTYDISSGIPSDSLVAEYLNNTDPNHIVLMSVYDSAISNGAHISQTVALIQSWGCSELDTIEDQNSFIFVGKASANNIPSWTYCRQSNDTAIFKSIQLPANAEAIPPSPMQTQYSQIINRETGKCISSNSSFLFDECNINDESQQWEIKYEPQYLEDIWFKLISKETGCCMKMPKAPWPYTDNYSEAPDDMNFGCTSCSNTSAFPDISEMWRMFPTDSGYVELQNYQTGLCIY